MQSATLTISGEGEMYEYDSSKDIPWYDYKPEIRNLILNEGITTITQNVFSGLVKITEVNLPSTLKTIEFTTFYNCKSLKSVIIPDSVIYIGSGAFSECRDLESVKIGNGIKTINIFTFMRCTSLTSITFPETLERINSQAFSGCSSLENIQIPDKAINIESDCFIGTPFFTNPDNWEGNVLYLDHFLITGKSPQTSITVKDGTKYIGNYSLVEVYELQTVIIPRSVEFIGEFAIPKEVKIRCYENSYAHKYAMENGYVYEYILDGAVGGICGDNLRWVYDMQTATLTISGEGEMYEYGSKDIPWNDYRLKIENLILNEGITTISPNAFAKINKITEVKFPSTLKTIAPIAFGDCEQLVSIDIPGNVEYIGQGAFIGCISLEQLILRPGVKEISFFSFAYCQSLTSVSFPNTLKRIGGQAFYFCSSLENIQLPDTDIEIYSDCFWSTAFAKNPDNWENHALYLGNYLISLEEFYEDSSFTVREGTKYIAGYSLYGDYLKTVIIPSSVEFMYDKAIPDKNVKICCYKNSYAHKFAVENGYTYQLIG